MRLATCLWLTSPMTSSEPGRRLKVYLDPKSMQNNGKANGNRALGFRVLGFRVLGFRV